MTNYDLESVARTLVSDGKGILAAGNETIPTLTRRFDTVGNQVDRAKPAHLSRNAFYITRRRRVH